jgi:hypothetical protein
MSNRLRLTTIFCAVLSVSGMLAACDDSDDAVPNGDENGGAAGDSPVAGKSAGGSSSGSAGKTGGGTAGMMTGGAGAGGADTAGAGGMGDGGGEPTVGGAGADAGGAGGAAGAAGAGAGGGGAELEYACGASTLSRKLCSALTTVTCDEPTFCVECVPAREGDLELFAECPACLALHEASYQCAVDAYESGNSAAGIECFGIADINDACGAKFQEALSCNNYKFSHDGVCPTTWPMP